jgi:hypothetical protein
MYFQIKKLILWPRHEAKPRVISFQLGVVNVISGASKTGKSAVIPIIDYCLASDKCAIPVGVIRESCSWFGILVETAEGDKLLARREPGDQKSTDDMFVLEGADVEIPEKAPDRNYNTDYVKALLNRISSLPNLPFTTNPDAGYRSRPSFRDLVSFNLQPQNIVANPDVFFFKADTTEHREKLKAIFPFLLGAVTGAILQARFELDRITRLLRRKEQEQRSVDTANNVWRLEASGWLREAVELGLVPPDEPMPIEWSDILSRLRLVVDGGSRTARPTLAGMDRALVRLRELREEESSTALALNEHRHRLNELRRLLESSEAYAGALRIQRDRIALSAWFRDLAAESKGEGTLSSLSGTGREEIDQLCNALEEMEIKFRSQPTITDTLDQEMLRQRRATETMLERLNRNRRDMAVLERRSAQAAAEGSRLDRVERFLGRLQQALKLYDQTGDNSKLRDEIDLLRNEAARLLRVVSERDIKRKLDNALDRVARIRARGLGYWADPSRTRASEVNHNDGGRGVYFADPDGHYMEVFTRPL